MISVLQWIELKPLMYLQEGRLKFLLRKERQLLNKKSVYSPAYCLEIRIITHILMNILSYIKWWSRRAINKDTYHLKFKRRLIFLLNFTLRRLQPCNRYTQEISPISLLKMNSKKSRLLSKVAFLINVLQLWYSKLNSKELQRILWQYLNSYSIILKKFLQD